MSDGTATDTGTPTIIVTAANDAPTVVNDTESTDDNTALSGILLLDDDSDVDGDTLTLTGITSLTNGSVALVGNTVTYTPTPNTGTYTETLTYTVSDGTTTSTGTLAITVNASNDAPVAVDDTETLTEDDPLTTITVLDDDTDADGDSPQSVRSATQGPEPLPRTRITPQESTTPPPPTSTVQIPSLHRV